MYEKSSLMHHDTGLGGTSSLKVSGDKTKFHGVQWDKCWVIIWLFRKYPFMNQVTFYVNPKGGVGCSA